ncbi:hypothetical protein [Deinococcus sp.]|uniref:hypothetical protein n=1 Tax=Deinococcus sp. TaxID=47478 RepID=UPI003C7A3D0A
MTTVFQQAVRFLVASLLLCAQAPSLARTGVASPALKFSAPIVITRGGVYRGNWQSLDPRVPAVTINTPQPVTIEDSNVQGRGDLIYSAFVKARVTVRRTRGVGLNPGRPLSEHAYAGRFIHFEEFGSAVIDNNELTGTSGMYFRAFLGQPGAGDTVRIRKNRALNIDGRYSTGPDTFSPTQARLVQFVQFNNVRNLQGAEIAWNEVINQPGKSRPEEVINMYVSSGTAGSPILIHDNYIQGAYPAQPSTDASYAGGGMNVADGSGKTLDQANGFISAYHNVVVGTGNQGVAVSAGHDIQVYENRIMSSGYLPDGRTTAAQNVGLYAWDAAGDRKYGTFFNISVWGNLVGWSTPLKGQNSTNPWWFPDCPASWPQKDGSVLKGCTGNRKVPGRVTQSMEAQEYALWKARVVAAGIVLGR